MRLKGLVETDFVNYKYVSMFLITDTCDFKCDKEYGTQICQNSALARAPVHEISNKDLLYQYVNNTLTHAIVFGGLEPLDSWQDIKGFIQVARKWFGVTCPIVIYTGYTEEEAADKIAELGLMHSGKIVVKYGRYIPNQEPHIDNVLGVSLASDNQYAKEYNFL